MSGQSNRDNRANQMNPNNDAFWQARGLDKRPSDWRKRLEHLNDKGVNTQGTRSKP